nr:unnamed protein product [Callosobruchus analis]
MNNGRSKRILEMCLNDNLVMLPTWETTKGLSPEDREPAMAGSSVLFEECEDSDIPSSEERLFSSDSDEDPTYIPEPDSNASDNDEYIPQPRGRTATVTSIAQDSQKVVILSDVIIKPGDPLQQSEQNKLQEVTVSPKDVQTKDAVSTCRELRDKKLSEVTSSDKKYKRKPDYCFFCDTDVQNFARHIQRNHLGESEVQKILTLPVNSLDRKRGIRQNLMLPKNILNTQLRTNVFPRMLADQVSLKAKKDALICAYGSRYINTHREQHHINICSRKMRELAKLLIQCQKLEPTIKNLFDLLQPQFFDMVVESVKVIARYNPETDVYRSPTFAMNISRSLKDCCDIAILHIIKRKYNYLHVSAPEAEANIGKFRQLLENMWKHEISSHAGRDLNTKTWNKVTLVPLATDLKMFRSYLVEKGNTAAQLLQQDKKNMLLSFY